MPNSGEVEWLDYNVKAEAPNAQFNLKKRSDGNDNAFVGYGGGVSADVTLLQMDNQLTENLKTSVKGPSLGATAAAKLGNEDCLAAIVEPSLAKAEAQYKITEKGSLTGSVNVNATTGVKLNKEGVKFGFLGFGATLGVGGKWTLDTPVGSAGYDAGTQTNQIQQTQSQQNGKNLMCAD